MCWEGWHSRCGRQKERVPEGVHLGVWDQQFSRLSPLDGLTLRLGWRVPSWGWRSIRPLMTLYVIMAFDIVLQWLGVKFWDKIRSIYSRDKILHTAPGSPPLNVLKTVGQYLLVGVPYCGSILHDGSDTAFVAVSVDTNGQPLMFLYIWRHWSCLPSWVMLGHEHLSCTD